MLSSSIFRRYQSFFFLYLFSHPQARAARHGVAFDFLFRRPQGFLGNQAHQRRQSFDLEKLPKTLERYPELLQSLEKTAPPS